MRRGFAFAPAHIAGGYSPTGQSAMSPDTRSFCFWAYLAHLQAVCAWWLWVFFLFFFLLFFHSFFFSSRERSSPPVQRTGIIDAALLKFFIWGRALFVRKKTTPPPPPPEHITTIPKRSAPTEFGLKYAGLPFFVLLLSVLRW